jgi:YD repeat-containing protein
MALELTNTQAQTTHRIDWDGRQNVVVIDTPDGGHVEMTLERFVKMADAILTGMIEPGNSAYRRSFKKLPSLAAAYDLPGGRS